MTDGSRGSGPSALELQVRKGSPSVELTRDEFRERFRARFADPAFESLAAQLGQIEDVAWQAYRGSRKSPRTQPAGAGYDDPGYALSLDWLDAHHAIRRARELHDRPGQARVLVIAGGARSDRTCPGEQGKTQRLVEEACDELRAASCHVDLLDLSRLTAEYGATIYPCKGCVSTAMPLCHWPCSCYPNHGLGQSGDMMADIYPLWVAAHGVLIVTPVYWYQTPATLKLMIDRMVCADGGNPDPTSTHGKDPAKAKAIELAGWSYPRHLEGRAFGLVVHGDTAGVEVVRRNLHDWLCDMALEPAGPLAEIDRYIGYYQPYATGHDALDADRDLVTETRNVARVVAVRIAQLRGGQTPASDAVVAPRPK
ncbi:MAG TPA: flavodoxin family protein [Kofleriaceae bacterium]|jgi:multimeric flavodoxin WrbA|nr:flavodoxin family protein [Kofleriaceae bacterium]